MNSYKYALVDLQVVVQVRNLPASPNSLVRAKMGVVKNFARDYLSGTPNLEYVPTPMSVYTQEHVYM